MLVVFINNNTHIYSRLIIVGGTYCLYVKDLHLLRFVQFHSPVKRMD